MSEKGSNERVDIAKKPKGLWPGERMFAADTRYWVIVCVLWFLGLVLVSALLGKISALVIIGWVVAFFVWIGLFCIQTIPENMRAKPIFFGVIGKKVSWGTTIVLVPKEKLILFPTGVQQITLTGGAVGKDVKKTGAGIQTTAGWAVVEFEDENGVMQKVRKWVSEIVLAAQPVLNFRWPSLDDDLTETIKNAPPPEDLVALEDKIGELVLDVIRSIGGKYTYVWLLQHRDILSDEINEALKLTKVEKKEFDDPTSDIAGQSPTDSKKALAQMIHLMRLRNLTVSFKDMDLHDDLLNAQIEEAAAIHKGEAERIMLVKKGEGSKEILRLEGEGKAYAEGLVRTKILDVLTDPKYANVAMQLEGLKAFTDASQGGKGTIIFPTELLSALGGVLGKPSSNVLADIEKLGISQEKLAQLIASALEQEKT